MAPPPAARLRQLYALRAAATRQAALALVAGVLAGCAPPPAAAAPEGAEAAQGRAEELRITFLDVGQGDAALVVTPEGRRVLIDAGPDRDDVARRLRARGVDTVDLAVASHNHADHIGGMAAVLHGVVVRAYLDNGLPAPTATYARTLDALEARGVRYLRASERTVTVGTTPLRVLPMPPGVGDRQNDHSVGVVVEHGGFRALFTGDAEDFERAFWRESGRVPSAAVLKVSHHGSVNGTDPAWLATVRPSLAVISVGAGNTYGHPAGGVLDLLAARGVRTLRTDQHGEVVVAGRRDGTYTVRTGVPGPRARGEGSAAPASLGRPPAFAVPVPALPAPRPAGAACCRVCRAGQACGKGCISRSKSCHQPPGCACDG